MQLSSKSYHACMAVLDLSLHHHESQPVSLRSIADDHGISSQYLVQVLLQLKRAGIVVSVRGASGGYRLSRDPEEIRLLDVIEAVDGPITSNFVPGPATDTHQPSRSMGSQAICDTWQEVTATYREQLAGITFDELILRCRQQQVDMYYI